VKRIAFTRDKKMKNDKKSLFAMAFLAILLVATSSLLTVMASAPVTYVITSVDKGFSGWGFYWVGSVNLDVTNSTGTYHYKSYCIDYNIYITIGQSYTGTAIPASDTTGNRSISYILTWYSPPENDTEGAATQEAIWKYATGTDPTGQADDTSTMAYKIYTDASDKDVVREGDTLTLNPASSTVPVGTLQKITAKLVDSDNQPRKDVKILFSTTFGTLKIYDETSGTFVNGNEGITNNNGEIEIEVTSPIKGEATVTAETKGYWTNILWYSNDVQRIIGIEYPTLTAKTETAFVDFFVVPFDPIGPVAIASLMFTTSGLYFKLRKRKAN
jgi:hypothetical protein